jgi:hypothetical protein
MFPGLADEGLEPGLDGGGAAWWWFAWAAAEADVGMTIERVKAVR